ncbi:IS66-like element accessory protein TnpA [Pseudomonas sp. SDO5522_S412]
MTQQIHSSSKLFKAQVIAECARTNNSTAHVALTHNLNTNFAHKWIQVHAQKNLALQTVLIPVKPASLITTYQVPPATVLIEVPYSKGVLVVREPAKMQGSAIVKPRITASSA